MGINRRAVVGANVDVDAKYSALGFGWIDHPASLGGLAVIDECEERCTQYQ